MLVRAGLPRTGFLNELEIAALFALYALSGGAPAAHFSGPAIASRFRSDFKGWVLDGLEELAKDSHGFIVKKPTGGGMTYALTPDGIRKLHDLKII